MKTFKFVCIFIFLLILQSCISNTPNTTSINNSGNINSIQASDSGSLTSTVSLVGENLSATSSIFGDIKSESQGFGSYKIVGALKSDIKSISVVWKYDGKQDEPYTLKKFIPEKRVFEYYVKPKFNTIKKGINTYIFTGLKDNGEKEQKDFIIEENKDISLDGKYCILDICINQSLPYKSKGNNMSQIISSSGSDNEDSQINVSLDFDKNTATYDEKFTMGSTSTKISKLNNVFVKYSETNSCGPTSWKQEILDPKGAVVNNFGKSLKVPQKFNIGNKIFLLEDLNNDTTTYIYGTLNDHKEIKDIFNIADSTIGDKILLQLKKEKDSFPKKYILFFKEYPEAKFVYSMKDVQPERIVFLGSDKKYLSKNLDSNGDLLDINVTNKILSYYSSDRGFMKGSVNLGVDRNNMISSVSSSDLPIFHLEKLTNDGFYLLYPKKGYLFQSFAEMCKPVIYVYNKDKIKLNVGVKLFGNSYFTKLIPYFNNTNSWDFYTTNSGGVIVGNETYPYLYYSAKVSNYKFNNNGWIIKGDEVNNFFIDKLEVIGFNKTEKSDFINFWIKQFEKNSYYFISFKFNNDLNNIAQLNFSKNPKSLERVLLESYKLDTISGKEQFLYSKVLNKFDNILLKKFNRNSNFDIFEWGGVLKNDDTYIIK